MSSCLLNLVLKSCEELGLISIQTLELSLETIQSRNEDHDLHFKHLCLKTLKTNVRKSQLVWDIQHLGFLHAEGSQNRTG